MLRAKTERLPELRTGCPQLRLSGTNAPRTRERTRGAAAPICEGSYDRANAFVICTPSNGALALATEDCWASARASHCFATHSAVVPRAGGRLHGPDDAQVEPPQADLGRPAIASVGHRTTGSPRSQQRPDASYRRLPLTSRKRSAEVSRGCLERGERILQRCWFPCPGTPRDAQARVRRGSGDASVRHKSWRSGSVSATARADTRSGLLAMAPRAR